MNTPNAYELATAFSRILRDTLTDEQLSDVRARNAAETNPSICHSHDYCDANQVMIDALQSVGYPYSMDDDALFALECDAWELARAGKFAI
jgi:hypothetical protein